MLFMSHSRWPPRLRRGPSHWPLQSVGKGGRAPLAGASAYATGKMFLPSSIHCGVTTSKTSAASRQARVTARAATRRRAQTAYGRHAGTKGAQPEDEPGVRVSGVPSAVPGSLLPLPFGAAVSGLTTQHTSAPGLDLRARTVRTGRR